MGFQKANFKGCFVEKNLKKFPIVDLSFSLLCI